MLIVSNENEDQTDKQVQKELLNHLAKVNIGQFCKTSHYIHSFLALPL